MWGGECAAAATWWRSSRSRDSVRPSLCSLVGLSVCGWEGPLVVSLWYWLLAEKRDFPSTSGPWRSTAAPLWPLKVDWVSLPPSPLSLCYQNKAVLGVDPAAKWCWGGREGQQGSQVKGVEFHFLIFFATYLFCETAFWKKTNSLVRIWVSVDDSQVLVWVFCPLFCVTCCGCILSTLSHQIMVFYLL